MELIFYIVIFIVIVWLYFSFVSYAADNFSSSSGISKVFWFLILLGTLSFLFGSNNSNSDTDCFGCGGGEFDDGYCEFYDDFDCDDD